MVKWNSEEFRTPERPYAYMLWRKSSWRCRPSNRRMRLPSFEYLPLALRNSSPRQQDEGSRIEPLEFEGLGVETCCLEVAVGKTAHRGRPGHVGLGVQPFEV